MIVRITQTSVLMIVSIAQTVLRRLVNPVLLDDYRSVILLYDNLNPRAGDGALAACQGHTRSKAIWTTTKGRKAIYGNPILWLGDIHSLS